MNKELYALAVLTIMLAALAMIIGLVVTIWFNWHIGLRIIAMAFLADIADIAMVAVWGGD